MAINPVQPGLFGHTIVLVAVQIRKDLKGREYLGNADDGMVLGRVKDGVEALLELLNRAIHAQDMEALEALTQGVTGIDFIREV